MRCAHFRHPGKNLRWVLLLLLLVQTVFVLGYLNAMGILVWQSQDRADSLIDSMGTSLRSSTVNTTHIRVSTNQSISSVHLLRTDVVDNCSVSNSIALRTKPLSLEGNRHLVDWYSSIERIFSTESKLRIDLPGDDGVNIYADYDVQKPRKFTLHDVPNDMFLTFNGSRRCFIPGTRSRARGKMSDACSCEEGYAGTHCSVPTVVKESLSMLPRSYTITPRINARRIIMAVPFNMEMHVLLLKILQMHSAVDLFVILESNYTGLGDRKPLRLLHNMRRGFLKKYQHKIMHVFLDTFPSDGRSNGWVADEHFRKQLGPAIEKRVSGLRKDDLCVMMDTDETPDLKSLVFLKLHDGYPFPIGFRLQRFFYGFYWTARRSTTDIIAVCTIQMFRDVYAGNSYSIRNANKGQLNRIQKGLKPWGIFHSWFIGSTSNFGGWHASWFSTPGDVLIKLKSAINADFPRWGDYPEKNTPKYVISLFRRGVYFDENTTFDPICFNEVYVFNDAEFMDKYRSYFHFMFYNPTFLYN